MIEALEGVATTDAAELILAMALSSTDFDSVPQQPDQLEEFVVGGLHEAIAWTLDVHSAESVVVALTPLVERARSQQPSENESPTLPSPPAASHSVLLATTDIEQLTDVSAALGPSARVRHIEDVYDLVAAVEGERDQRPTVLIDCSAPAIDLHALAQVLPMVPEVKVVLWGSVVYERQSIARLYEGAADWLCCDTGLDPLREALERM